MKWADKNGLSHSYAVRLCREGRIRGAVKEKNLWLVPARASFKREKNITRAPGAPRFAGYTEAVFQAEIIKMAQSLGWTAYHTYNSLNSEPGFPDLVLVRDRVIFREVKTAKGTVSPPQHRWIKMLRDAGEDAGIWRPRDWDRIETELNARPVPNQGHEIKRAEMALGVILERIESQQQVKATHVRLIGQQVQQAVANRPEAGENLVQTMSEMLASAYQAGIREGKREKEPAGVA